MTEEMKRAVLTAIVPSGAFNNWNEETINLYLEEFRNKGAEIPKNIDKDLIKEHILNWVEWFDDDLTLFKRYNKLFESTRVKVISLSELGEAGEKILRATGKKFVPVPYDPVSAGTWEEPALVYAEELKEHYEFWFAIKGNKEVSHAIEGNELSNEIRTQLIEQVKLKNLDFKHLDKIVVKYFSSSRIINIVKIDKNEERISFATDIPAVSNPEIENSKKTRAEERIYYVQDKIIDHLGLKEERNELKSDWSRGVLVNQETVKNITKLATDEVLIIPHKHERSFEEIDGLSEKNINIGSSLTLNAVKRAAKQYFDKEGTFRNFFNEYSHFDLSEGRIEQEVSAIDDIQLSAKGFYICLLDEEGHIEVNRIDVNSTLAVLKVTTAKGGKRVEAVTRQLNAIFSKQIS
ncbi:MAG: hypothetical protein FMNOHCHN_01721 [Ignavibacteriaceae bacterium]|nr:hypothetical protein [Ignavibacteriaceae bacterium]